MRQTDSPVSATHAAGAGENVSGSCGGTPPQGIAAVHSEATPASDVTAGGREKHKNSNPFLIDVPAVPTQQGPMGVRFDFNDGVRVLLPQGKWHVQLEDAESGNIIFACDSEGGWVLSSKKYYVPFRIKVWVRGEQTPILDHTMNLQGKEVQIRFPVGTLGDIIGWLPYAERFQKKHGCVAELTMGRALADLFAAQYPQLFFTAVPEEKPRFSAPYATYYLGLFFKGNDTHQPIDFRQTGLHRTAGYILDVDPREEAPRVRLGNERLIKERYVCIATKSSSQAKFWNNGAGWEQVVAYLKSLGYRVLCIDKEPVVGHNYVWNRMPHGAEDFTGDLPLQQRVALLEHADFFIGLSSGLSWLAWCCRVPVVLISGFTQPLCEFYTPYRVYCSHGCHGCWDDVNQNFDHYDFFWCPRFKNTDRQYECTRLITGQQVIGYIKRLMQENGLSLPGGANAAETPTK